VLLFKIKKQTTNQKDKQAKLSYKLLYSFSYPLIIIMTIEGFLSRANANWAAASYVGASLLVCFYLINNNKVSLVKKIVGFHVLLAVILYLYFPVTKAFNIEHTEKSDFAKRLRGWDEISKEIQNYSKKHPNAILLFDERKTITPPLYYIKPHPFKKIAKFNPSKIIQDHYDLTVDLEENFSNHEEFLLFTRYPNSKHIDKFFNKTTPLGKIKKQIRKNFYITLNAFLLEGFKGY
jgi:hypothetical protein